MRHSCTATSCHSVSCAQISCCRQQNRHVLGRTHSLTHSLTLTHSLAHSLSLTLTHSLTHSHSLTHFHSLTLSLSPLTYRASCTRTTCPDSHSSLTHSLTHALTRFCLLSPVAAASPPTCDGLLLLSDWAPQFPRVCAAWSIYLRVFLSFVFSCSLPSCCCCCCCCSAARAQGR